MKFSLIVPTYNAGFMWKQWIEAVKMQDLQPLEVIVIDSSSTDGTDLLAKQAGFKVVQIDKAEFNHGATRNKAAVLCDRNSDILIYLTQDAILSEPSSLRKLVKYLNQSHIAEVCGRQLPHKNANPLATFIREFNYPPESSIKDKTNISKLGIKTAFMSNSFAAYRKSIFEELGGFPNDVILAEDMYLAAKIVLAGYQVAYCAEATVYHSHNYTLCQEFKRYFDTGCFHLEEPWIMETFGNVSGEGKKLILKEWYYLLKNAPVWLPYSFLTICSKAMGFYFGKNANKIPKKYWHYFSMFR
ncbi:glycosyltransferase family 2 protein [Mannheimia cairinae]|uniref:glycosyltransferase family 2 protein n=1 Tax=Mannheimia cairinae TaxID=3025936 RepID=UPI0023630B48|nr:glycosyltransferase [Mannheimia cairinae]MDD0826976.1 glycosyltransferase [Mannheimia cairinae]